MTWAERFISNFILVSALVLVLWIAVLVGGGWVATSGGAKLAGASITEFGKGWLPLVPFPIIILSAFMASLDVAQMKREQTKELIKQSQRLLNQVNENTNRAESFLLEKYKLSCGNCSHFQPKKMFSAAKCNFLGQETSESKRCQGHSDFLKYYNETLSAGINQVATKVESEIKEREQKKAEEEENNSLFSRFKKTAKTSVETVTPNSQDAIKKLNALTGLNEVKSEISKLQALLWRQNELGDDQKKTTSLHMVFSGGPGTGKTTVARIIAELYKEMGLLSQGHLVEVDRSDLVAGFLGQTAIKTQDVIKQSLGGVLFIDEAYSLSEGNDAFGGEAINTLLKAMEDNRDDLAVIVAGYKDEMHQFVEANPGLRSRFRRFIHFKDYDVTELLQIFEILCDSKDFRYSKGVLASVKDQLSAKLADQSQHFANGREVRNLVEQIEENMSLRLHSSKMKSFTAKNKLNEILPEDVC